MSVPDHRSKNWWGLLLGVSFLLILMIVGMYFLSPYTEPPPKGKEWKTPHIPARWKVMREGSLSTYAGIIPPKQVSDVGLALSSEQHEREGWPFSYEEWTDFHHEYMIDDLQDGVYGTVWSCPRWTLEFTVVPKGQPGPTP